MKRRGGPKKKPGQSRWAERLMPCILRRSPWREPIMTLCPIAIVAGCKKCPAFSVCPLKTVIGDAPKADEAKAGPPKKNEAAPT
ncbi:MAG: hypothetical protein H7337_14320 [Rhizobacter sp.]|nr:hypothetical protein [Rhizobacter sp.]